MRNKITAEALEAYTQCRTKFHLKIVGLSGQISDYEIMLKRHRAKAKESAIKYLNSTHAIPNISALKNVSLIDNNISVINIDYEDESFCIHIDGLKCLPEVGGQPQIELIPTIFGDALTRHKNFSLILQVYGHLLSKKLNLTVTKGIIWLTDHERKSFSLVNTSSKFSAWLIELLSAWKSSAAPPLLLNDHCQICEFRGRCREQATEEGNLSLLRGMTENEIAKYNAKGLFNIDQLSYTFRSRRLPKRSQKQTSPHYFSLQAQAIRERKIFVHGSTDFSISQPRIYFDIEAIPYRNGPYLIGALVETDNNCRFYSYWSDSDNRILGIFTNFIQLLAKHPDHVLLHYGSFETDILRRAKLKLPASFSDPLEQAIARSINILNFVRSRVYFPTYSNSLKEIAGHLGATWSDPVASGIQSLVWREKWLASRDVHWKHHLIRYNREDCEGLKRIVVFLDGLKSAHKNSTLVSTSSLVPRVIDTDTDF